MTAYHARRISAAEIVSHPEVVASIRRSMADHAAGRFYTMEFKPGYVRIAPNPGWPADSDPPHPTTIERHPGRPRSAHRRRRPRRLHRAGRA